MRAIWKSAMAYFKASVAHHGGAIYSSGTLIIKNSTFYGNAAG